MKVLHSHIITGIAGSESYLLKTLPLLKKSGVEIEFLCFFLHGKEHQTTTFVNKLIQEGIPVHKVSIGGLAYFNIIAKVDKVVSKGNYDVVHTHLIHADVIFGLYKWVKNRKLKLVSTKHGYQESYTVGPRIKAIKKPLNLYFMLAKFAEKRMDKSYAISASLRDLYVWLGVSKPEKIEVIEYGFDFAQDLNPKDLLPNGKINLVIVGRLEETKGHLYALQALFKLIKTFPNLYLTLVGVGSFEGEIRAEIKRLNLNNYVNLKGYQPNGLEYMNAADVVLVPSIREGFGIVVLEAFSQKKPLVVFDVPAVNQIVEDGVSGYVVPAFDTDVYAEKISQLCQSELLKERIGNAGYELWQRKYTSNIMLGNTIKFYENLIGESNKKNALIFTVSEYGGGTEKICRILGAELQSEYVVHKVFLSKHPLVLPSRGFNNIYLDEEYNRSYLLKLFRIPIQVFRLARFIREQNVDVVLSMLNRPNYVAVLARLICAKKFRLVISERTYTSHEYRTNTPVSFISKLLIKKLYPLGDLIISNSKVCTDHLIRDFKIPRQKTITIHNGVEPISTSSVDSLEDKILAVGRLDKNKNHSILISALAGISHKKELSIAGSGAELSSLKDLVNANSLNNRVKFLGYESNLDKIFLSHSVFVLTSIHEGFPNVILEAMAAKCVVVSSDCYSGPREILQPGSDPNETLKNGYEVCEYGILTAVNDLQALIGALNFVFTNSIEVEQIREKAYERALGFDQKKMVANYLHALTT